jgi:acetyl esterase/lipase
MKLLFGLLLFLFSTTVYAQGSIDIAPKELIYGRKDGMALTMFVQSPAQASNGRGIIVVESGNWKSSYEKALRFLAGSKIYTDHGYTVFTVLPGSQPRYTIPDQIADLKRAVRFIRHNAGEYDIDPDHIAIMGFSSGGHLSLSVATADDTINPRAADPVDRVSSKVQAVAVFYPPTDFLNFGRANETPNRTALVLTGVFAAFDFKDWNDTTRSFVTITDEAKRLQIARQISPLYSVNAGDPPTLIIHGDSDILVPLQQSESIIRKFEEAGVPSKLIIKKGGGHGWKNIEVEENYFLEWFDKYLK